MWIACYVARLLEVPARHDIDRAAIRRDPILDSDGVWPALIVDRRQDREASLPKLFQDCLEGDLGDHQLAILSAEISGLDETAVPAV